MPNDVPFKRQQTRVLVCSPIHAEGIALLKQCALVDEKTDLGSSQLLDIIPQYHAVVLRSGVRLTREMLTAGRLGNLRIIGLAQAGMDNVDLEAAKELEIKVVNSNANAIATCELTMTLILGLARNIIAAHQAMLEGIWDFRYIQGMELCGKTLGIIGLGNIGLMVAQRAQAFDMKIRVFNRTQHRVSQVCQEKGYILCELDDLLRNSDIITLHLPLTTDTTNLINSSKISIMKETAFIINCARGGIVNEQDLLAALKSNRIAGAALDVFEQEPLPKNSPLIKFANRSKKLRGSKKVKKLHLSPHLGSGTKEAQLKVAIDVAEQICEFFSGEP